ncbi:MAG TPA: ATP-binding cassette domain-containing protein, partial [Solirubrobacteraceae bacterium]|nr:ATP-binding cassette domain-containing protein [Solirubrobacteraceae bacterium]
RENLEMVARLFGHDRRTAKANSAAVLDQLGLADAADRLVRTYSGGMRRRLDLAASLVATPPVLFLDEPTTGLDPRSRVELWGLLEELVRDGATVLLTTQYLDEADRLADDIVVLDRGRIAAQGSPAELKARIGGERLEVTVGSADELASAALALGPFATDEPAIDAEAGRVVAPVRAGVALVEVVRALDAANVDTTDLHRREATLDDVFLTLTDPSMELAA